LSTDPDPTLEPRGTSGYTVALPSERPFDRVIKTQRDQIPDTEFRQPFPPYLAPKPFGVFITKVECAPTLDIDALLAGAELRLMDDPCFELRNQIVGDGVNRLTPPIVPYVVQIGRKDEVYLRRSDPLDPSQPERQIWDLAPRDFAVRVPVAYRHLSDEVVETIFPPSEGAGSSANANALFIAYFNQRKQWLQMELSKEGLDPVAAAAYRTRARIIDGFTNPTGDSSDPGLIENRLGLQSVWDHPIRGQDAFACPALAPYVDTQSHWRTRFWMGGWDGDLLVGWIQGRLNVALHDR